MLKKQANIGINCGIPKENTFILKNGDSLVLKNHIITRGESNPGADIYVDGNRIGEIGSAVLKDRKVMASDGIYNAVSTEDWILEALKAMNTDNPDIISDTLLKISLSTKRKNEDDMTVIASRICLS